MAMQVLVENGADVNITDDNGYTALSYLGKNWISILYLYLSFIFTDRKWLNDFDWGKNNIANFLYKGF